MTEEYYRISPKVNDIDFYIGGIKVESLIQLNSQVEASATKIVLASSSVSVACTSSSFARRIITASSEVGIQLVSETVSTEILNVLTEVHIASNIVASPSKISYAASSLSFSINSSATLVRQTNADSYISILSNIDQSIMKIVRAISQSNVSVATSFRSISILLLQNQINVKSRVIVNPPIRFSPSYIDESSIRTLLILDGKPLTNHGRDFDVSLSPLFIENINWNNKKNRYYKRESSSGRKTFNITWKNLPNSMEDTVDFRHGRDYIHSIAEDPDSHELKIINQNENGLTPYTETAYTVFVTGYNETLTRRYLSEGVYLYECSLTLEEV